MESLLTAKEMGRIKFYVHLSWSSKNYLIFSVNTQNLIRTPLEKVYGELLSMFSYHSISWVSLVPPEFWEHWEKGEKMDRSHVPWRHYLVLHLVKSTGKEPKARLWSTSPYLDLRSRRMAQSKPQALLSWPLLFAATLQLICPSCTCKFLETSSIATRQSPNFQSPSPKSLEERRWRRKHPR